MPDHAVPHPDVAGYVLGVLEPEEQAAFAAHLPSCSHCQREVAELEPLRTVLDSVTPPPAVPPGLADRTLAAVEAASESPAPRRAEAVWRRPRLTAAAVAAIAAAALAAVVVLSSPDRGGREIALVAPDDGSAQAVARLRRGDPGIAVDLDVEGLAPAPAGGYYECWYVGDHDSLERPDRVSAGTFTVRGSGTTRVRMVTAADPRRYPRIEVTLEPDDGDPARTGPVVLSSPPRPAPAPSG